MMPQLLLDYMDAKYGREGVMEFAYRFMQSDGSAMTERSTDPRENEPPEEGASALTATIEPEGTRLGKADLGAIKRKLASGETVYIVRKSDGERVRVIKVEGMTLFFDRAVSDGKGRLSDHRSRHSVLKDWGLVL